MNEGKAKISDQMWNEETPSIEASWSDGEFQIETAFDTDTITLNSNEASRLRDALNKFLSQ